MRIRYFRAVLLLLTTTALGQTQPSLRDAIAQIKIVDDHAHVQIDAADHGYDELPCDAPAVGAPAFTLRTGNTDLHRAFTALYGTADTKAALAAKERLRKQHPNDWHAWVLDRAGTEIMFANRIEGLGGLPAARFRWVPYDDALLFPLDPANERAVNGDRNVFHQHEQELLAAYMKAAGVSSLPATLHDYVENVLKATLQAQKKAGAPALKFEMAYLRSLRVDPATEEEALNVYQRYRNGGSPPRAEYKKLQDYLFRQLAIEAGRLKLPLQIHTGAGCGDWFDLAGSDPVNLDRLTTEPAMRDTQFVILHGGWPFTAHTAAMMLKPNVWGEFSAQTLLNSTHELTANLRRWLETAPQKVLYGSDSGPTGENYAWEESTWAANQRGRDALARALDGMIADGELSRAEALAIARGVLRETPMKLYGLTGRP